MDVPVVRLLLCPGQPVVQNHHQAAQGGRPSCHRGLLLLLNHLLGESGCPHYRYLPSKIVPYGCPRPDSDLSLATGCPVLLCIREVSPRHQGVWAGVQRPSQRPQHRVPARPVRWERRAHGLPAVALLRPLRASRRVPASILLKDWHSTKGAFLLNKNVCHWFHFHLGLFSALLVTPCRTCLHVCGCTDCFYVLFFVFGLKFPWWMCAQQAQYNFVCFIFYFIVWEEVVSVRGRKPCTKTNCSNFGAPFLFFGFALMRIIMSFFFIEYVTVKNILIYFPFLSHTEVHKPWCSNT